ncbi:hypothetical protein [Prauserella endophytica]|uniref:Uncharacterized protein n=1 Tax=Prauserella endophytica TaxID=1592324 RepID=A0ABY2SCJ0_9PSEU|nr:hypothetical protein [Prauserella endophytica]TKG72735.1 hypothetical protein FCN18_05740 [Prauserella endophytica]
MTPAAQTIFTGERRDGTTFAVDQWQLASAVTLLALRAGRGVLSLTASGWALAREDVERGYRWRLSMQRPSQNTLTLHLHDTRQTTPHRVQLIDITGSPDGGLRAHHRTLTAAKPGLSGDTETDTHLAIMLTMLRENGGTLSAHPDELAATAELIHSGHHWRVVELPFSGKAKTFQLEEPEEPPG